MSAKAYDYALNLLAARAYTTRNLRRKLTQREYDPVETEQAIERLLSSRLLDDDKYAMEFARQRLVNAGAPARRVEQVLRRRGIDREAAVRAIAAVMAEEDVDTLGAMEILARKKLRTLGDLDAQAKRRRLFGFLARRGYDLEDIRRTVDMLSHEPDS